MLYRTDANFEPIKPFAVEVSRALGLLLKWCDTKVAQTYGKLLWEAKADSPSESNMSLLVPIETALAVYHDSNPGRKTYCNQRKILSASGHKILPPWYALRDDQRQITIAIAKANRATAICGILLNFSVLTRNALRPASISQEVLMNYIRFSMKLCKRMVG